MEYIVNVAVVVDTPNEEGARYYVDRKLKGPYTQSINVISVEHTYRDKEW